MNPKNRNLRVKPRNVERVVSYFGEYDYRTLVFWVLISFQPIMPPKEHQCNCILVRFFLGLLNH